MRRASPILVVALAALAGAAPDPAAAQKGRVVRVTDLRAAPAADAALVQVVPANTEVPVIERQGGWYKVLLADREGWIRLTAVRFAAATPSASGGLTASLGFLRSGRSASQSGTVTTGVRGLSETDLQNAVPDPQAVDALDRWAVPADDAQQFARAIGLAATEVEFIKAPDKDKKKDGKGKGDDDEEGGP